MIRLECPKCGWTAKVRDELAGKKGRCGECGYVMEIPSAPADTDAGGLDLSGLDRGRAMASDPTAAPGSPPPASATAPWQRQPEQKPKGLGALVQGKGILIGGAALMAVVLIALVAWSLMSDEDDGGDSGDSGKKPQQRVARTDKPTAPAAGKADPGDEKPPPAAKPDQTKKPDPAAKKLAAIPMPPPLPIPEPVQPATKPAVGEPKTPASAPAPPGPLGPMPPRYLPGSVSVAAGKVRTIAIPQGGAMLACSDDGERVAYWKKTAAGVAVGVVGRDKMPEKELPLWEEVEPRSASFTPDGKHLAFLIRGVASGRRRCAVVLDGKMGQVYPVIEPASVTLSPDGKRLAYVARADARSKQRMAVIDGERGPQYPVFKSTKADYRLSDGRIFLPRLPAPRSPTGGAAAKAPSRPLSRSSRGLRNQQWFSFSPDSRHVCYRAGAKKTNLVLDGKVIADVAPEAWPIWSARGGYVLPVVRDGRKGLLVGGAVVRMPSGVKRPAAVSGDGKRIACVTRSRGERGYHVACNQTAEGTYSFIDESSMRFLPDGRLVYRAAVSGDVQDASRTGLAVAYVQVVDGVERHELWRGPCSVDGKRSAHLRGDSELVIDGVAHKYRRSYWSLRFSPDGLHVACVGNSGGNVAPAVLVLDGAEAKLPGALCPLGLRFVSPTVLDAWTLYNDKVEHVELKISLKRSPGVPPTTPGPTDLPPRVAERARKLHHSAQFELLLRYHGRFQDNALLQGEVDGRFRSVALHLTGPQPPPAEPARPITPGGRPPRRRDTTPLAVPHTGGLIVGRGGAERHRIAVRTAGQRAFSSLLMDRPQANRVIDYLAKEGYLDTAVDVADHPAPTCYGPTITLTARRKDGRVCYFQDWGLGPACMRRLAALSRALPEGGAKGITELLRQIRGAKRDMPKPTPLATKVSKVDLDDIAAKLKEQVEVVWIKEHRIIHSVPMDVLRGAAAADDAEAKAQYWVLPICFDRKSWRDTLSPCPRGDGSYVVGCTDAYTVIGAAPSPARDKKIIEALGLRPVGLSAGGIGRAVLLWRQVGLFTMHVRVRDSDGTIHKLLLKRIQAGPKTAAKPTQTKQGQFVILDTPSAQALLEFCLTHGYAAGKLTADAKSPPPCSVGIVSTNGNRYAFYKAYTGGSEAVEELDALRGAMPAKAAKPFEQMVGLIRETLAATAPTAAAPAGGGKDVAAKPVVAGDCLAVSPDGTRQALRDGISVQVTGRRPFRVEPMAGFRLFQSGRGKTVQFSPNSEHLVCVFTRSGRSPGARGPAFVVTRDNEPHDEYYGVVADSIQFSPDGRRLAYVAKKAATAAVVAVIDGREGPTYFAVGSAPAFRKYKEMPKYFVFSPDSKRVAYPAQKTRKTWVMVVDGAAGKTYNLVSPPAWSAESRNVAYVASAETLRAGTTVVINGVEVGPRWRLIANGTAPPGRFLVAMHQGVRFSGDGSRFAFVGVRNTRDRDLIDDRGDCRYFVECNGLPGKEYPFIDAATLKFLDDGRVDYRARTTESRTRRSKTPAAHKYVHVQGSEEAPASTDAAGAPDP